MQFDITRPMFCAECRPWYWNQERSSTFRQVRLPPPPVCSGVPPEVRSLRHRGRGFQIVSRPSVHLPLFHQRDHRQPGLSLEVSWRKFYRPKNTLLKRINVFLKNGPGVLTHIINKNVADDENPCQEMVHPFLSPPLSPHLSSLMRRSMEKNVLGECMFRRNERLICCITSIIVGSFIFGYSVQAAGQLNDSDGDGLPDAWEESVYHSNPHVADTDGDGYTDRVEIERGFNPSTTSTLMETDLDHDGLSDRLELLFRMILPCLIRMEMHFRTVQKSYVAFHQPLPVWFH